MACLKNICSPSSTKIINILYTLDFFKKSAMLRNNMKQAIKNNPLLLNLLLKLPKRVACFAIK